MGKLNARERLMQFFDEDSFFEIGSAVVRRKTEYDNSASEEQEGVICGYGAVEGLLVFAFAQDFSKMKGAVDAMHIAKIKNIFSLAEKNGAPIVAVFDSAGASMLEGVDVLAGYGELLTSLARLSGVIPRIAVVDGVCTGSAALMAASMDFVVTAGKDTDFSLIPRSVLKFNGDKTSISDDVAVAKKGMSAVKAESEEAAFDAVKKLITLLPSCYAANAFLPNEDDLNRDSATIDSIISAEKYDVVDVIKDIADIDSMFELSSEYGTDIVTAFGTMGGQTVGFVATQPVLLSSDGMNKAAKFITFCDCFGLPVITLLGCKGYDIASEVNNKDILTAASRLANAYASATVSKITLTIGEAYGSIFTLFGSKGLGCDVAFATKNAVISVLPPESAVAFMFNDKLAAAENVEAKKNELTEEWKNQYASSEAVAKRGQLDAVVNADDIRRVLISHIEMLSVKREITIPKKRNAGI